MKSEGIRDLYLRWQTIQIIKSSLLDKIFVHKRKEVEKAKQLYPEKLLKESESFGAKPLSLKAYLARPDSSGIIAEIKRRSPSKGIFQEELDVEALSIGYMQAGACGLSVLTDTEFFGGNAKDLQIARRF